MSFREFLDKLSFRAQHEICFNSTCTVANVQERFLTPFEMTYFFSNVDTISRLGERGVNNAF